MDWCLRGSQVPVVPLAKLLVGAGLLAPSIESQLAPLASALQEHPVLCAPLGCVQSATVWRCVGVLPWAKARRTRESE